MVKETLRLLLDFGQEETGFYVKASFVQLCQSYVFIYLGIFSVHACVVMSAVSEQDKG